jgi:hypothetical protein
MSRCAWQDVTTAMEVDEDLGRIFAPKPVCLRAAGKGDGFRGEFLGGAVLEVDGRCRGAAEVAVLGERERAEVGAEGGKCNVLVVGVCAVGALEGGREGST